MRAIAAAAGLLLVLAASAQARPGALDRTFASGGRVAYNPWGAGGTVHSLALLDGRRPLLSLLTTRNGTYGPTLFRLTAGGALAETTALPEKAGAPRFASGYALTWIAPQRFQLARIGSPLSVTLAFDDRDEGVRFGVDRAGRAILVGGGRIARFLPSGKPDPSYGSNGAVTIGRPAVAVLIRRDGRVYVSDVRRIVAFDTRGRRDRRFGTRRIRVPGIKWPTVNTLSEGPGGTLLVTGRPSLGDGFLGRLRADGRTDLRFGRRGFVSGLALQERLQVAAVARDRRGRIVLAGARLSGEEDPARSVVLRLTARGRLDRTFANRRFTLARLRGVKIVASGIEHIAIDDRNRIVVAGNVYDDEFELREDIGNPYPAIARLQG